MIVKKHIEFNGALRRRGDDERRLEIIRASERLFAERGFSGTSVEAIAEQAKCSKSAIYSLFGSKEALLKELTLKITDRLNKDIERLDNDNLPVREFLSTYVRDALTLILSPQHIGVVRTILSETTNSEQLGKDFYNVGPKSGQEGLSRSLQRYADAGHLEFDSAYTAAVQVYGLMLWGTMMPMLTGSKKRFSKAEIDTVTHQTVEAFLRIYSPSPK